MNTFIFTCGDINGIGPEIIIKTLNRIAANSMSNFVIVCPRNVFEKEIQKNRPNFTYNINTCLRQDKQEDVQVLDIGFYKHEYGLPTDYSGNAAYNAIEIALNYSDNLLKTAIITAPISKKALSLAKINFPGHTEMLANWFKVKNYVMMFLSNKLNASLLTIHEPIKKVSRLITPKLLNEKLDTIISSMNIDFRIINPQIALLGLNPHCGEEGIIGTEEINTVKPFLFNYKFKQNIAGPFSPDAFWGRKLYKQFDMIVGMYHDQVLIPFKLLTLDKGVNFTAGLPIVRTSPDHGTAYEIAGKGIANESSMLEAYYYAKKILNNRQLHEKKSKL